MANRKETCPCPIQGCDGVGKANGSYTTCNKQNCAFQTLTTKWKKLYRPNTTARRVVKEMDAVLARIRNDDFEDHLPAWVKAWRDKLDKVHRVKK